MLGTEFTGDELHPVSTKHTNSTANVALLASMWWRDTFDLRHEGFNVKSAAVSRTVPKPATKYLDQSRLQPKR
jgi:hypothetical protein